MQCNQEEYWFLVRVDGINSQGGTLKMEFEEGMCRLATFGIVCGLVSLTWAASLLPVTEDDKRSGVDAHNKIRAAAAASAMRKLKWNDQLAQFAQNTAMKCAFEHTTFQTRQHIGGFEFIGENIYTISTSPGFPAPTIKNATDSWGDEIKDYDLNSNSCKPSAKCGHYTQIVWSATTDVGCAISQCDSVKNFVNSGAYLIFCNYGIGGNMVGEKPYEKASSSSEIGSKCQQLYKESADSSGLCGSGTSGGTSTVGDSQTGGQATKEGGNKIADVHVHSGTGTATIVQVPVDPQSRGNNVVTSGQFPIDTRVPGSIGGQVPMGTPIGVPRGFGGPMPMNSQPIFGGPPFMGNGGLTNQGSDGLAFRGPVSNPMMVNGPPFGAPPIVDPRNTQTVSASMIVNGGPGGLVPGTVVMSDVVPTDQTGDWALAAANGWERCGWNCGWRWKCRICDC